MHAGLQKVSTLSWEHQSADKAHSVSTANKWHDVQATADVRWLVDRQQVEVRLYFQVSWPL